MASLFSVDDMDEIFRNQTVLALGKEMLNPTLALEKAMHVYGERNADLPLLNATFHLIWLPNPKHSYDNRLYIFFTSDLVSRMRGPVLLYR